MDRDTNNARKGIGRNCPVKFIGAMRLEDQMENLQEKMARFGHSGRVIVFTHHTWRVVTHIPRNTSWHYMFDAQCSLGEETQPQAGDAVFDLCSSNGWLNWVGNDLKIAHKLDGQANMFFVLG